MIKRILAASAAVAVAAFPLAAQPANRNVLSIQPLSAFFEVYNLEFERMFTPGVSGGAGFTYWSLDEDEGEANITYLSVDIVKLRYYPSGTAPSGFSFGGSVGVTRVDEDDPAGIDDASVTAPGLGISLEYSRGSSARSAGSTSAAGSAPRCCSSTRMSSATTT
jgi:hypothetical protein